ncbi:MAG: hypothetical protein MSK32_06445 [Paraprevotella sp.]|nr:hypothetical protein [Paraprevotella sp.]
MKKIFKIMTLALVGVFALASCGDDVPSPNPNPNPGGGDEPSTEVVDITCAQAIELCTALADNASSAETYAITGYITDVFDKISEGQQSFWLSDNNDGQKMVQAYWANLPEGVEKFVAGSKVKITGKLLKYVKTDGTVIIEVKNADVEILEAGTDEPSTDVTEITCAKAIELCAALADNASSTETYAITGYITDVFAEVSKGQQSFWISDNNDGQKMVQAYWANLPEGVEKFVAGSKVKITGKLIKYVKTDGTVITEVKNADVEILEAGTDEPSTDVTEITCAKAIELCAALADNASSAETYAITGYITDVFATVSEGQQSFWLSDNNDGQKMVQAYWANLPEGVEKFVAGSKVKITGKLLKYVKTDGTVITEIKNADVEILEAGGDTPDTPSEDNTFEGADATVVMSEAYSECTDGSVDATPITFDAVQVSFDKNDGNNPPKYYWNGNAVRMYAKNSMTVASDKQIAKIVIKCTAPDSKNYNGNDEMTTTAGTIQKADDKVTIVVDGINQKEVTITNDYAQTSSGTQLRILSMGVYYVK